MVEPGQNSIEEQSQTSMEERDEAIVQAENIDEVETREERTDLEEPDWRKRVAIVAGREEGSIDTRASACSGKHQQRCSEGVHWTKEISNPQ